HSFLIFTVFFYFMCFARFSRKNLEFEATVSCFCFNILTKFSKTYILFMVCFFKQCNISSNRMPVFDKNIKFNKCVLSTLCMPLDCFSKQFSHIVLVF